MVLLEIDGVVKDVPVPREEPPVDAAYQFSVPALAEAVKVTVPEPQRDTVEPVAVGIALIVAMTPSLETDEHPLLIAST
jgi:hypothetical protein